MAYISNIPASTDQLSQSQSQIQENFNQINIWTDVDHVAFTGGATNGQHKRLTMTTNAAPGFAAGEMGFYRNTYTNGGFTTSNEEIIYRDSAGNEFPITASAFAANEGWAFLPSGLLMKFGRFAVSAGNSTHSYPVAANIPVFSAIYSTQVSIAPGSPLDTNVAINIGQATPGLISYFVANRTTGGPAGAGSWNVYYTTIGAI